MNRERTSNPLLTELIIVTLFFILSALILVNVFSAIRQRADRADILTRALPEAQDIADLVYASEDVGELMARLGFEASDEGWERPSEGYTLIVTSTESEGLLESTVSVESENETLIELPCSRFMEGGAAS